MKHALIFTALIATCLSFALASNVVDLTPDNFDQFVDGSKAAFVEFYAPWCGHCKRLAPDYEVVGDTFAGSKDVVIAKVDADAHRELGSRFGIQGFPTLKFFPKGSTEPEDYKGGRSIDDIVEYVNSRAGTHARVKKAPTAVVHLTADNFDQVVLDTDKDVVVEFYAPWCGHCKSFAPDYEKIAQVFGGDKDVVIAAIDADKHRDIGERYGVTGFPTIKFFGKSAKDAPTDVNAERSVAAFVDFVNEQTGTARQTDGSLKPTAGRLPAFDDLAARFMASAADRAAVLSEAESAAASESGRNAEAAAYYVKVMNSVLSKGDTYAVNERARLQRVLDSASASVASDKATSFAVRRNILGAFQ